MKHVIILLFFCCIAEFAAYAELPEELSKEDELDSQISIIETKVLFHGWSHCGGGNDTPYLDCDNGKSYVSIGGEKRILERDKNSQSFFFVLNPSLQYENGKVINDNRKVFVNLEAGAMRNSDEYSAELALTGLKIGNNYIKETNHSSTCHFYTTAKEGFSTSTTITIDNPIEIVNDKDFGEESLRPSDIVKLRFNDFYEDSRTMSEIQFSINEKKTPKLYIWKKLDTYEGSISPNGEVRIRYSDINGNDSDKLNKFITFRVVKRLINQTYVQSNRRIEVKFSKEVPDITYVSTPYVSSCNVLSFTVKVSDDKDMNMLDFVVKDKDKETGEVQIVEKDKLTNEIKILNVKKGERIELKLQPKSIYPYFNNSKQISITVPEIPPSITATQIGLQYPISKDTKKYHLVGPEANNPYALLSITDNYNRTPYTVKWQDSKNNKGEKTIYKQNHVDENAERENYFKDKNNQYFESQPAWNIYFNTEFNDWFADLVEHKTTSALQRNTQSNRSKYTTCITSNTDCVFLLAISEKSDGSKWLYSKNLKKSEIRINTSIDASGNRYIEYANDVKFDNCYKIYSPSNNLTSNIIENFKNTYNCVITTNENTNYPYNEYRFDKDIVLRINKNLFNGATNTTEYTYITSKGNYILCKRNSDGGYYLKSVLGGEFNYEKRLKHYSNGTSKYYLTETGSDCAYVSNNFLYYNDKQLGSVPSDVAEIFSVKDNYIYYKTTDGKYYRRIIANYDDRDTYFNAFRSQYSTKYNDWLGIFKKACFQHYLLLLKGYKIDGLEANTDYIFTITDKDGCTTSQIPVNVKVPIKPDVKFAETSFPSSACSKDGTVTAQIEPNSPNKNALYYSESNSSSKIKITTDTQATLSGIGNGVITLFDEDGIEYDYDFTFSRDASLFNGIQSVTKNDIYCEKDGGNITINFNENSQPKKYILYDNADKAVKEEETTNNKVTFSGLGNGSYKIKVEITDDKGKKCELSDNKTHTIEQKVFSFELEKTDADDINGEGKIEIINEVNKPNNIEYTIGSEKITNINDIKKPAGQYTIKATYGSCSLPQGTTIEEPYCEADVEVTYKSNGTCDINITNTENSKTTYNRECCFKIDDVEGISRQELSTSGNHKVSFVYDKVNGKKWEVEITPKNNLSEPSYTFTSGGHKCVGDEATYNIQGNKSTISLGGNNFSSTVQGSTKSDAVNFMVKGPAAAETKTNGNSKINLKCQKVVSKQEKLTQVEPFSADVIAYDFNCGKDHETQVRIENIAGGKSNSISYSFNNKDFYLLPINNNIAEIPITSAGTYTLYFKDEVKKCPSQDMGSFEISKPSSITIDDYETKDPICKGSANGSITVKAKGGTIFDEYNGYLYYLDENNSTAHSVDIENNADYYHSNMVKKGSSRSFDNLKAGDYWVSVVDNRGCQYRFKYTLDEYKNPSVSYAQQQQTSCYGFKDGKIKNIYIEKDKKASGTVGLTYHKAGETTKLGSMKWTKDNDVITDLPAGDYKLYLEDSNECASDGVYTVEVTQPDPITLEAQKLKDVTNFDGSDGEAQLHVTGGNDWSKEIYILKKYTESSEVTEDAENTDNTEDTENSKNSEDSENTEDAENTDNTEGAENTENTEVAEVTDLRQIGGTYTGRNAKLGEASILPGLGKGTYALQVKDLAKGCLSNIVESVEILAPDEPISAEVEVNKALCANQTGSVTVRPKGGWGEPFKVELNGQTLGTNADRPEVTFDDMMAGTYALRITDRAGATLNTMTVEVPRPNDPINFDKSELLAEHCEADGAAHIVIDGGTGSYHTTFYGMEFDTPEIDLALLKAGDYTLEVIDSNECESNYSFTIADNRLAVGLERYYTTAENNTSVAVIEASVSGGMEPYTYEWRRVDNEPAVLRVAKHDDANATPHIYRTNDEDIYVVKISDAANCMRSEIIPLLARGSHDMKVVDLQRETSLDAHDGYAVVESDRTDFTSKRLYNAQTDEFTEVTDEFAEGRLRVSDLAGGDYALKCVLPDGRLRAAVFTIEPYIEMSVDTLDLRHASLPGKADGLLKLNVNGGIAPFTLKVTHTTDETYSHKPLVGDGPYFAIDSLVAGTYNLEVTDSTSNVAGMQFTVIEPEKLTLRYTSRIPVTCYGYTDGSVRLAARGGWGKYQFARANKGYDKSDTFRGLPSGSHRFRVIDRYGTEQTLSVYIDSPDSLEFALAEVDSVSCHGLSDGAMRFNVVGGNGDYTLRYTIGKDITEDMEFPYTKADTALAKLTSRNYQITFTDKYGCYAYDTLDVFIPQPEELRISNADITNTTCDTDNGRIQITTDGGSLPYRYSWVENGETDIASTNVDAHNNQIVNLKQDGLYQVGITDLHGCATEGTYRIDHSSNPKVSAVSTVDVTCFGLSDGIAAVDSAQVVYGYPWSPFTLTWPQGQNNTMSVNTLPTGSYYVRITDQNNCVDSTQFEVGTPQPVKNTLLATLDAHCYGYSDGRIETRTTGGVGEYSYLWDTGATTSYAENIPAGSYTVVVRDAHNCADTAEYSIGEPEELIVDLGDDALICPQGHHVFDGGEYNTYEWYKVGESEVIEFGRYMAVGEEGDYRIVVTDRDGCFARDTVRLSIGENALVADFLMASDASLADTVMIVRIVNMPLDSLRWENVYDFKEIVPEETKEHLLYLRPQKVGTYNITLKAYSGGCEAMQTKEIEIFETLADDTDFDITYNPLIKSVKATPNPNDGNFTLNIELREAHECSVRINSVIAGHTVDSRKLSGADRYAESYDISGFGNGLYVMSVEAGKERRVMKLLVKSK